MNYAENRIPWCHHRRSPPLCRGGPACIPGPWLFLSIFPSLLLSYDFFFSSFIHSLGSRMQPRMKRRRRRKKKKDEEDGEREQKKRPFWFYIVKAMLHGASSAVSTAHKRKTERRPVKAAGRPHLNLSRPIHGLYKLGASRFRSHFHNSIGHFHTVQSYFSYTHWITRSSSLHSRTIVVEFCFYWTLKNCNIKIVNVRSEDEFSCVLLTRENRRKREVKKKKSWRHDEWTRTDARRQWAI